MASEKEQHIPAWDGSSRTWRRYTREVCWYVRSTPVEKRRYCATKLVGRLRGPARLLAMSWTTMEFDHINGTRDLLQRLAASPLVRQTLPNAAATCQQYFNFRRDHGEAMNTFLVREALGYSEFVEALLLLYEDKKGVKQHEKTFDLPEEQPREDYWDWWPENEQTENEGDAAPPATPQRSAAAAGPSAQMDAGDGSVGVPSPPRPRSMRSVGMPSTTMTPPPGFGTTIDEFSLADSFVLGVLRGFRLLQSAGLTADEKRDILSATKGSLEFDTITQALQTLWDEQFLGRSQTSSMRSSMGHHANFFQDANVTEEADAGDWWTSEYDGFWADASSWHDGSWDDWQDAQHGHVEVPMDEQPEDPAIQESLQAEKEAESLALQAHRTWSEAQRATAALRRDRGFGKNGGKNPADDKCDNCGGDHYARDCPDRYHPSAKSKGKGKFGYAADWDYGYENINYAKGKPKGRGNKGKSMHPAELQALWKGKGKSRPMAPRASVNAYTTEALCGMELKESMDLQTTSSARTSPGVALLDCGATASAGPEESVKSLIGSILAADRQTTVTIAKYMRPFFRFGNGRWGQANYRVSITSNISGKPRSFHMYCLPNPPEFNQPNFDKNNLVPVLLGMDHLSGRDAPESALTVDFHTGLAVESLNPTPKVHQLPVNSKGHYVRDIVEYITLGYTNTTKGSPSIHVLEGVVQSAELQTLEFHPVEFYVNAKMLEGKVHDASVLEKSRQNLLLLHARNHGHVHVPEAHSASMSRSDDNIPNSNLSASLPSLHGAGTTSRATTGHGGHHQVDDSKEGTFKTARPQASDECGRARSSVRDNPMALSWKSHSNEGSSECPRRMGALRHLQSEVAVHSKTRQREQYHQGGKSHDGAKDAGTASAVDERLPPDSSYLPCNAEKDRCRGDTSLLGGSGDREAKQPWLHHAEGEGKVQGGSGSSSNFIDSELYGIDLGSGAGKSGIPFSVGSGNAAALDGRGEGTDHEDPCCCLVVAAVAVPNLCWQCRYFE